MLFSRASRMQIPTSRLMLRLPRMQDYTSWLQVRRSSADFLRPWEPVRDVDIESKPAFRHRVRWASGEADAGRACPFLLIRREDRLVVGALTLDNIRRGPAQSGTMGYWIGQQFARQGYMEEAVRAVVEYAFSRLNLSRIEAACLPENEASRGLLEKTGFRQEGVAENYLQIAGDWRTHVLFAQLRSDRQG